MDYAGVRKYCFMFFRIIKIEIIVERIIVYDVSPQNLIYNFYVSDNLDINHINLRQHRDKNRLIIHSPQSLTLRFEAVILTFSSKGFLSVPFSLHLSCKNRIFNCGN